MTEAQLAQITERLDEIRKELQWILRVVMLGFAIGLGGLGHHGLI